ncbi:homocysteine-responsive endoplasmic reticulum-resident ubiquitin-like domain member 1 protein [Anguilla rostrata]|uniref:homocysteine-responsive endoplasmic reticulum-resident ubiquitin-like domain member 1 protein n=1 Tax=Anguilla rostrata TaxID=7938 RepID=UPI0030D50F95
MDNPSSSPEQRTLTIVVKTPNQAHHDQIIKGIDINWTVKDLKKHLFQVYPNNPPEKDQRIIYSGKLLLDHLPIRDAFRRSDPMPTVHLVCAFRALPAGQLGAQPKAQVTPAEQRRGGPSPLVTGEDSGAPATPPSPPSGPQADGLRRRGHPTGSTPPWTGATAPSPAQMTHPTFPTYSLYSPQQLLWLQQMYARQYYMHYQAAMAAAASAPVTPAPAPHPAALPNPAPIDNLPANQNVADPQFINPGGANPNLRMNAQGGPVMEDEEDGNRDWLDWAYTAARFTVFLSIVYFYSTLSRFVLVMSSLFFMYLHTAGWFPFRRRPVVPVANEQAPEVIQNQQNQNRNPELGDVPVGGGNANADEGAEEEGGAVQEGAVPEDAALPNAVLVPPHRVSLAWTVWVFFKGFFASLIPDLPQGVAN